MPKDVTTFEAVACTVCGCVCDDLTVTVQAGRIIRAERACHLAEPWLLAQTTGDGQPPAHHHGEPVPLEAALDHAATLLATARTPLIYGLSRSTTDGQRAAVALADRLGATIDTTASTGHAPSILALQQVGESTCTLGEVRHRADLVIFWGSDPHTTHPRHRERYCPPGVFTIVADTHETATAQAADLFVPIAPGTHWDTLWTLRLLIAGHPVEASLVVRKLASHLTAARFGVVFFGAGLTHGPAAHKAIEALLRLVTDLNTTRRFYARRMRRFGDVAGADSVLTWQTGYPFGVNLAAGYPRYNPGEFTAPELLLRGEVDVVVVVGADTLAGFPQPALDVLRTLPVILLDPPGGPPLPLTPHVAFTTAVYGIHKPGTAYRLDEVPIPLRTLLPTPLPTDAAILTALLHRVPASSAPRVS